MNWEQVEGNWRQLRGKFKEQWGKLTDDDLAVIQGKYEDLVGKIQEQYGLAREEAERQVREFTARLDRPAGSARSGQERKRADMAQRKAGAA